MWLALPTSAVGPVAPGQCVETSAEHISELGATLSCPRSPVLRGGGCLGPSPAPGPGSCGSWTTQGNNVCAPGCWVSTARKAAGDALTPPQRPAIQSPAPLRWVPHLWIRDKGRLGPENEGRGGRARSRSSSEEEVWTEQRECPLLLGVTGTRNYT